MKFLYPQVLWALIALLIPIIIHLFNFKRYKTIYFSSLQFIKKVDQEARSTKQLKRWLILAARVLAFTALIFAFAQPYWNSNKQANYPGQPVLIYVDNSFSMQAQGVQGELLSMAKEKVRDVVQSLPNNQLFIIVTNALSGREERLLNKADAFEKIDQIDFSGVSRKTDQVLNWEDQTINKHDPEHQWKNIQSYYFSDFQQINSSSKTQLKNFSFFPVLLKAENTDNLYVDSLWFEEPINRVGRSNRLNISLFNDTDEDLSNVELEFSGDAENKVLFVDLPSRTSTKTAITITNTNAGLKSGSVKIADQNIFFDDAMYYSYMTEKKVNILVLNGEDASPNVPLIYSLDQYYDVTEKDFLSFTRDNLKNKDLIVLNGINEFPSGVIGLLNDAIESGTSVGLFPGRKPVTSEWNKFLNQHHLPLLSTPITGGNKIKTLNYSDPFYEGVFEKKSEKLNLPGVSKVFVSPGSGNSSNVLISLVNGSPLFVNSKEEGEIYMFYSSLHDDFGNFVKDALCSTLFLRMGERSKRIQPLYLEMGKQVSYPIFKELSKDESIKIVGNDITMIPVQNSINDVTYIQLNNMRGDDELDAGNYELMANSEVGVLSLNYSRLESNLKTLTDEEIGAQFGDSSLVELQEMSSSKQFDPKRLEKASGAWRLFLFIAIIFVVIEMLLIRLLK